MPVPIYQAPVVDLVTPTQSVAVSEQNYQFLQEMESDSMHWDSAVYSQ